MGGSSRGGGEANETASAPHQLGALDSVKWKIGVAMESSKCSRLAAPFVGLVLNIRDDAGVVTPTTLELTLEEFYVVFSQSRGGSVRS